MNDTPKTPLSLYQYNLAYPTNVLWALETHERFPKDIKNCVKTLFMLWTKDHLEERMPLEILCIILQYFTFQYPPSPPQTVFSVDTLRNNPHLWRPSYENVEKVNTKLAILRQRIIEGSNIYGNPLVKISTEYIPMVQKHHTMVLRHLPVKIYLRIAGAGSSIDTPYALLEEISANFTRV